MSEIPVTNWAGNLVYEASERLAPTSVEQVQDAVRAARASGKRLRVVGTRHCFNAIADTDGVHVTLRDLPRRVEVTNEGSAWVDGGITYAEPCVRGAFPHARHGRRRSAHRASR